MAKKTETKTSGSRTQLREAILSGHYMAGTTLPSARELAKKMQISKSLVHNILKLLQEEGLIQMSPGRGAVVLENRNERPVLKRFFLRPSDFGTFRYLPITRELLSAVSAGAERKNAEMLVSFSDSGRLTEEIIAHHTAGTIQGVIYFQCSRRELIEPLEKAHIPYVIAADTHGLTDTVCTYIDFRDVARQAVRHLVQHGHKDIGIITGSKHDYLYAEMLAGFRGALAEENRQYRPEWVLANVAYEQAADQVEIIRKYLSQPERPSAVFTVRDYRAAWFYQAARELGLRIPEDISIISFDNHTWPGAADHRLTTIAEPLRTQGEQAVALLQSWVQTGLRPERNKVDTTLIERGSVKTLPQS